MATTLQTRDHDTIRHWVSQRGGVPTIVKGTGGLLRIDFVKGEGSGGREPSLHETSWDRWFEIFENRGLAFLYSPEKDSRLFKLIGADTDEEHQRRGHA